MGVRITPWSGGTAPTENAVKTLLHGEGLVPYAWSNGPLDRYPAHSHDYDKVIYVLSGRITSGLPDEGREVELGAGDRLDHPADTVHGAVVSQGLTCLEVHR